MLTVALIFSLYTILMVAYFTYKIVASKKRKALEAKVKESSFWIDDTALAFRPTVAKVISVRKTVHGMPHVLYEVRSWLIHKEPWEDIKADFEKKNVIYEQILPIKSFLEKYSPLDKKTTPEYTG